MAKVIMKQTKIGSKNGIKVEKFEKGKVYNISGKLYDAFIDEDWCQDYIEEMKPPQTQNKKSIPNVKEPIDLDLVYKLEKEITDEMEEIKNISNKEEKKEKAKKIKELKDKLKEIRGE
jgi:hypothetical protein